MTSTHETLRDRIACDRSKAVNRVMSVPALGKAVVAPGAVGGGDAAMEAG